MAKTIRVSKVLDEINSRLKTSTCNPDVRKGMINVLEEILHSTGNYRGFLYLTQDKVPVGHKAGIISDKTGYYRHQYPDDTRRSYRK